MWRRRTIDGIHPAATAKIAWRFARYGDGTGLVGIPVDLRQYLPGLRTTALASAMVNVSIGADEDWNDVHAHLLTALDEHRYMSDRPDPKVLAIPLPRLRELLTREDDLIRKNEEIIRQQKLSSVIGYVSHLGTVNLADFCADGFEATWFSASGR